MEKYYKVSEEELIELLASTIKMNTLEKGGVDNWCWYGANFQEVIDSYSEELGHLCESFEDCAKFLISMDYERIE